MRKHILNKKKTKHTHTKKKGLNANKYIPTNSLTIPTW